MRSVVFSSAVLILVQRFKFDSFGLVICNYKYCKQMKDQNLKYPNLNFGSDISCMTDIMVTPS